MGVPPEALIRKELIGYAFQAGLLGAVLFHAYTHGKKTIFRAFLTYGVYLGLHISTRGAQVGYAVPLDPESLELFSHVLKSAFFLIMGYAFLDALITEKTLKKILRSNLYIALILLVVLALGIVMVEGKNFEFMETVKEVVYEIAEVTVTIMIINIIIHSWMDTKARNLNSWPRLFSSSSWRMWPISTASSGASRSWSIWCATYCAWPPSPPSPTACWCTKK